MDRRLPPVGSSRYDGIEPMIEDRSTGGFNFEVRSGHSFTPQHTHAVRAQPPFEFEGDGDADDAPRACSHSALCRFYSRGRQHDWTRPRSRLVEQKITSKTRTSRGRSVRTPDFCGSWEVEGSTRGLDDGPSGLRRIILRAAEVCSALYLDDDDVHVHGC